MRRDRGRRPGARRPHGTQQKVTGVLQRIVFRKDDFVIATLDTGVAVKGSLPEPQVGMSYELHGWWEHHPRYGRQFKFDAWRTMLPRHAEAIRAYLQENAKWVGPEVSKRLVDTYGAETLDVCKADPERVAREITGITKKRAGEIAGMLREIERSEKLHIELNELLSDVRISRRVIGRVVEKWGWDAPRTIRENPYLLALEIDGVGFPTADELGKRLDFPAECPTRVRAGVLYILKTANGFEGHTCLPDAVLQARAREELNVSEGTLTCRAMAASRRACRPSAGAPACSPCPRWP